MSQTSLSERPPVPAYLAESRTYRWAYGGRFSPFFLDHAWVVEAILWGQGRRLMRLAAAEVAPGEIVLQPACVYGAFSRHLLGAIGAEGRLDVIDVLPGQVDNLRRKLAGRANVQIELGDAEDVPAQAYDVVSCFFLLHEVPQAKRRAIVAALLGAVRPGGRVVFVDYHRPRWWHPLGPLMALVHRTLEPFAASLWDQRLAELDAAGEFSWRTETYFGGLYQKTVATRQD
ncbi:MAG TPA: rhodoquinone biosynthesis methyltransferase RquA [Alphaproteobacteria bacterium]|jgi:SAM-dependent methyltransferase|nr:rhodoquinone biosynthesis methyltransferase RquA [Alphaproteobacteria bacterium]MDP6269228.1 rhodoquinone biosynthesis methyltransferase RquA [Alphaproteobacteria bacterium]MDP7163810.1 rhodoquinone biosynthesis methyltransferase RquA [Alphaproteobacteria bacterium]MDP7428102.1 rhodoquinone biosynthesis methyltransferase RquA [Alphaproteobacteria bacterium]HJM49032.1 rhodoquinone biosynthesis methyltransferase RquA [Alphaproteobacteria bacterium]